MITAPTALDARPEYVETCTMPDLLVRACALYGNAPALALDNETRSFADLHAAAVRIARALVAVGVRPGDRVGLFMSNSTVFVESLFGISMCGAVFVPINSRFRTQELGHVIRDAGLRVILTSQGGFDSVDHPQRLSEAIDESRTEGVSPDEPYIVAWGAGPCQRFIPSSTFLDLGDRVQTSLVQARRAAIRLRDVAGVLYTSGTTSSPKGCVHTHEALVRNGMAAGRTRFMLRSQDRFWDPLPMFHVGFLAPMIACLDAGSKMISMAHFDGARALALIETEHATCLYPAFHALAGDLIRDPNFASTDMSSVRMVMCVGNEANLVRLQQSFPVAQLMSAYGSTETGGVVCYHDEASTVAQRASTCGTPFRGIEIEVLDLMTSSPLPAGEAGEIVVRGFSVLDRYLNDPQASSDSIDHQGWLHTGDLGTIDDDGQLVYRGRIKDMLKVGGENVSATEIESLLCGHPSVVTAHVVGAPDERLDEVVAAFVQVEPDCEMSERDVVALCEGRIASFKVPRYVRFVKDWPMSATKVDKNALRGYIADELHFDQLPS